MIDRNLARGVFLAVIALVFGGYALQYDSGSLGRAGPGMFPLMVSGVLLLIAVITIVRSRFQVAEPMPFNFKNIGLLLAALCVFAGVSLYLNMIVAIVALVFIAGKAATDYSIVRNIKISVALIAVAYAFEHFLGLSLPLWG